jgi:ABC-type antimicrobial peptide transport system permease subunit
MIGMIGALLGVGMCFLAVQLVAQVMKAELGLTIEPALEPVWTFVLVMATILLAAASGVFPAALAYRTAVVRHLRPLG